MDEVETIDQAVGVQRCDGALAEFMALREEIQERFRANQQLLSIQLTLTAAVFG